MCYNRSILLIPLSRRRRRLGLLLVLCILLVCAGYTESKGFRKVPQNAGSKGGPSGGGGGMGGDMWAMGAPGSNGYGSGYSGYKFDFMDYVKSEESILRHALLANYTPDVRPVVNVSTPTFVNITLTIIQIMDLDEQNQVMITNAQIALKWHDEHLIWDPEMFNNQSRIVFSSKDIWTPDIVLFNSADVAYSTQRDNYLIDVRYDGTVFWMFPDILRSYCKVDIKYFPFDRQNCTLELQSWSRTKREVEVKNDDEKPFQNHSFIHTEWKLLNITVSVLEHNDFVWLEYMIHLKRNHAFYVNHMIFPFAILSSLTLFVFWLPPDSGEKITLTITILLALTVFLQLITDYTPKAAKSLPIIGLYFNVNLILVLISVILTIIVLNFHFRGPKKQRVPRWMRVVVIGYLGRAFCFCYESRVFSRISEEETLINSKKPSRVAARSRPDSSDLIVADRSRYENDEYGTDENNVDYENETARDADYAGESEPAYVKLSANKSTRYNPRLQVNKRMDYQHDTSAEIQILNPKHQHFQQQPTGSSHHQYAGKQSRGFADYPRSQSTNFSVAFKPPSSSQLRQSSSSNLIHGQQQDLTGSSGLLDSSRPRTSQQKSLQSINRTNRSKGANVSLNDELALFNEDITKNLEKMLVRMQKSFDPFKLHDESLKFAILKEILECQRLLLTANLANKKENQITANEIYDEWKVLAMIVDRICFFVYLAALVVSSVLFFLSEHMYDSS